MNAEDLLHWIPKILFALTFVSLGIIALKKRFIPTRLGYLVLGWFVVERIIELYVRYTLTTVKLSEASADVFTKYLTSASLSSALERAVFHECLVIALGAIVWFVLTLYAHYTRFEKIDKGDVNVFVFGALVSGWPNFILYIAIVFILTLLALVIMQIIKKQTHFIVTPFFAFAGLIMVFFGWRLSMLVGLYAIR